MRVRGLWDERVAKEYNVGVGEAKQSMKEECDINNIMRKYVKTGIVNHVAERSGEYGVAHSMSYLECMEVVRKANEMFAAVPAKIRKKFNNDPAAFVEFVSNKDNVDEMRKLGLARPVPGKVVDPVDALVERITKAVKAGADPGPPAQ